MLDISELRYYNGVALMECFYFNSDKLNSCPVFWKGARLILNENFYFADVFQGRAVDVLLNFLMRLSIICCSHYVPRGTEVFALLRDNGQYCYKDRILF